MRFHNDVAGIIGAIIGGLAIKTVLESPPWEASGL
jgi:hypothetical protein